MHGTHDIGGLTFAEGTVTLTVETALRMAGKIWMDAAAGLTAAVATPASGGTAGQSNITLARLALHSQCSHLNHF